MDHLHKHQRKKNPDPYALGLWGHGNDLGDSQLEKGEVTEDALFPLGEFPKGLPCFVAEPGDRETGAVSGWSQAGVFSFHVDGHLHCFRKPALPQTTAACHVASCFTACCISLSPMSLTPRIPGAAAICHVIAHYQAVSILRALTCLLMARRPRSPWRPGHCHLQSQLGLSFSC